MRIIFYLLFYATFWLLPILSIKFGTARYVFIYWVMAFDLFYFHSILEDAQFVCLLFRPDERTSCPTVTC